MSPWKVILATMVIFGSGVVTGALLLKMEMPSVVPQPSPVSTSGTTNQAAPWAAQIQRFEFLKRIQKQLNLTPAQHDEIQRIMKDSQERSRPIWDKIAPQMRDEVRRVHQEIRQVLTPDQQVKFEELLRSRPRKAEGNSRPMRSGAQTNSLKNPL